MGVCAYYYLNEATGRDLNSRTTRVIRLPNEHYKPDSATLSFNNFQVINSV